MKLRNAKLALSALGIVAVITGPAWAQKPHRHSSQQQMTSDPAPRTGRGIYNMVPDYNVAPNYSVAPNRYDPAATGGGSVGYNQMLHDNKW